MQQAQVNVNLTKEDYQNLVNILDTVDVKGRKAAEYVAILAMKLELRIKNWFEKHPTGFDIIEVAKTSEAYESSIKDEVTRLVAAMPLPACPDQYSPEPNRNLESLG